MSVRRNSNLTVSSALKDQAAGATHDLYNLIDLRGGGELVSLMKTANQTKDFTELDRRIQDGLLRFLYNGGRGQWKHFSDFITVRCSQKKVKPKASSKIKKLPLGQEGM